MKKFRLKKFRLKKERKEQYKYMLIGAVVCLSITTTAIKSKEIVNTVQAYSNEEQVETVQELSREELAQREMNNIKIEQDIFKPVYMSNEMMYELGVNVGDTIELPEHGRVTVRNINSIRENAVITFNSETDLNNKDIQIYEYTKVGGN